MEDYKDATGGYELQAIDIENTPNVTEIEQKVLSKREIMGWLAYAVAAEPYSVVCISSLLPIVLEALASGYGYQTNDRSLKCDT
ncbi:hypothetical protein BGZ49_000302, partial [Haplosporangium sp. Z 27]